MARRPPPPQAAAATQFQPGQSGNPGGRPFGLKPFSVLRVIADALADEPTGKAALAAYKVAVADPKTVLAALELAARLNGEIKQVGAEGSQQIAVVLVDGSTYVPGMFRAPALKGAPTGR